MYDDIKNRSYRNNPRQNPFSSNEIALIHSSFAIQSGNQNGYKLVTYKPMKKARQAISRLCIPVRVLRDNGYKVKFQSLVEYEDLKSGV
jgi:hypothetical protein